MRSKCAWQIPQILQSKRIKFWRSHLWNCRRQETQQVCSANLSSVTTLRLLVYLLVVRSLRMIRSGTQNSPPFSAGLLGNSDFLLTVKQVPVTRLSTNFWSAVFGHVFVGEWAVVSISFEQSFVCLVPACYCWRLFASDWTSLSVIGTSLVHNCARNKSLYECRRLRFFAQIVVSYVNCRGSLPVCTTTG